MEKQRALVYCEGCFGNLNGKTAHGLVRFTRRYEVLAVIDSTLAGRDAGEVLSGRHAGIPIVSDIDAALRTFSGNSRPTHLVIGLAPDGGSLSQSARIDVRTALERGLNVDSGLHTFLSEDPVLAAAAAANKVSIRDIRKSPSRAESHFYTGKIAKVQALKIAVLGSDSAIGKRTTSWKIVHALEAAGVSVQMVGTGQTAWLQGARYGVMLDTLINDFLTGEIEHAVWSAWNDSRPQVIIIEGQGGILNPAYPGGYEILAAAQPEMCLFQHAPARRLFDGFEQFEIPPLARHLKLMELMSGFPVSAVCINHENIDLKDVPALCRRLSEEHDIPVCDVLLDEAVLIRDLIIERLGQEDRLRKVGT